jgi:hypothetical protein
MKKRSLLLLFCFIWLTMLTASECPSPTITQGGGACGGTFWEHTQRGGNSLVVCDERSGLGDSWNDKISSYEISSGWECIATQHGKFGGGSLYLEAGEYAQQMPPGWNDQISSIKCTPEGEYYAYLGYGKYRFCEHAHFAGDCKEYDTKLDPGMLLGGGWNDRISSLKVGPGIKCQFKDGSGMRADFFWVYGPRNHERLSQVQPGWNDRISTLGCKFIDD